jgi:hypothetical protein
MPVVNIDDKICFLVVPPVPNDSSNSAADILYGDINSLPLLSIAPYRENEKLEIPSWNARFGATAVTAISTLNELLQQELSVAYFYTNTICPRQ